MPAFSFPVHVLAVIIAMYKRTGLLWNSGSNLLFVSCVAGMHMVECDVKPIVSLGGHKKCIVSRDNLERDRKAKYLNTSCHLP